ncbi:helicase [Carbonactinospora thermoautotrophica]|uniref:Helicase n=1 Tax=Carbonactinospora thermoautotrophica TaxID=1469144 RepID=A0A132N5I9_9ACTN|nr:helicase [Carbonactinospora thermoautotrophica]
MQATFWPSDRLPSEGRLALWGTEDPAAAVKILGLPPGEPGVLPTVLPAGSGVGPADVPARLVPIRSAIRALAALPSPDRWPSWQRPGDSLIAWSVAAKLALEHVAAGHLVPVLRPVEPGQGIAHWRCAADGRLAALAEAMPVAAHALRRGDGRTIWSALELLTALCDAVADALARGGGAAPSRVDSWPQRWVAALTGDDPVVELPDEHIADALASWAAGALHTEGQARLCVRLHAPDRTRRTGETWLLSFHLQSVVDPDVLVSADEVWSTGSDVLRLAGRAVAAPQDLLVHSLAEAARLFPPIDACLSEQRPTGVRLDTDQAAEFLTRGVAALTEAGIGVIVPDELTGRGALRLRGRIRAGHSAEEDARGSGFDRESLATFRWEAAIGDETLTKEDLERLVAANRPLVRWKGRWVRVDTQEAGKLARLIGRRGALSASETLAVALAGRRDTAELGEVEVVADGTVRELVERLRSAEAAREPRLVGVEARLRGYQRRGVAWLQSMTELGLGVVLADDMGLGKTLQAICLLAGRDGTRPHLVVCPTSVVGNWERELARFAPHLPVIRHHGPDRPTESDRFTPGAVVVTTYTMLRRDIDLLAAVDWDVVVLDEAQQIKNQSAQATRAAGRLRAAARVALTGTPVENRLSELWSIMNFVNPGLLGPFDRFKERFVVPVERWRDPDATRRLRQVVAPFLLRRVKAEVAADLPPKQESIVACTLTREQATLYQAAVTTLLQEGLGTGIERRGRILKLLTALKQICNHPAQYLGEGGPLAGRSGKLARATEMLAEVVAAGDRALVFTQYRVMGEMLARHLAAELDLPYVPFLHGGVGRVQRDRMVETFQTDDSSPPLLIVSLRAGGFGLNLTRATHVLHYDRWWNPAVEDQATDRAHRIGQTSAVNVYKLVTRGTLEERIADLLEHKRELAEAVVGTGETWLTELSDDELRALVQLSDFGEAE